VETKARPNQGIRRSAGHALGYGLAAGLALSLVRGLGYGLVAGLGIGLAAGGDTCLKHFALRLLLVRNGCMPWNYPAFLDAAADSLFLRKVGGGYLFVHRLLLDSFAALPETQQSTG